MDYISHLKKKKKRQFLIMSASSSYYGLQCLYIKLHNTKWEILHHQTIPYPNAIRQAITDISLCSNSAIHLQDLAILDKNMTLFLVDTAKLILSNIPILKRHLDLIILRKFSLWKGSVGSKTESDFWNINSGDAYILANALKIPILTDFARQTISRNFETLPSLYGDLEIIRKTGTIAVLVNIGITAHISVFDCKHGNVITDSDTGPGTYLIDLAAHEAGCTHGFDRDGIQAASGNVNTDILEILISDSWFKKTQPKTANINYLNTLYKHPCFKSISPADKISTLTAFTALSISNFFKKEYELYQKPQTIWFSGGGTNNLALMDFIRGYFSPIQIKNVETIGIPNSTKTSLALGVSVNAFLNGKPICLSGSSMKKIKHFGRWIFPEN